MPASDAPVIQHESRKLCLSILFGTRKNKVYCAAAPVKQLPEALHPESLRQLPGPVMPRAETS
jgi:hypothetical protein